MKVFVMLKENNREWLFDGVKHWFISSDNTLLHVKTDDRHIVIPFTSIISVDTHQ